MTEPAPQPKKTIRQVREERGWSQVDLALRLRVTDDTVWRWEHGRRVPTRSHQHTLARLFGLHVEDIAFGPAEQEPEDRP